MDEDLYKSEICIDDSKDALDNTNEDILSHIQEFYDLFTISLNDPQIFLTHFQEILFYSGSESHLSSLIIDECSDFIFSFVIKNPDLFISSFCSINWQHYLSSIKSFAHLNKLYDKKEITAFIHKFVNVENIEITCRLFIFNTFLRIDEEFFDIIKDVSFTKLFSNMKLSVFLNLLPFIMKLIEVDFTYASSDISVAVTFLYNKYSSIDILAQLDDKSIFMFYLYKILDANSSTLENFDEFIFINLSELVTQQEVSADCLLYFFDILLVLDRISSQKSIHILLELIGIFDLNEESFFVDIYENFHDDYKVLRYLPKIFNLISTYFNDFYNDHEGIMQYFTFFISTFASYDVFSKQSILISLINIIYNTDPEQFIDTDIICFFCSSLEILPGNIIRLFHLFYNQCSDEMTSVLRDLLHYFDLHSHLCDLKQNDESLHSQKLDELIDFLMEGNL